MARHAASSRLVRAPDELQAEDAHYWDRLLDKIAFSIEKQIWIFENIRGQGRRQRLA